MKTPCEKLTQQSGEHSISNTLTLKVIIWIVRIWMCVEWERDMCVLSLINVYLLLGLFHSQFFHICGFIKDIGDLEDSLVWQKNKINLGFNLSLASSLNLQVVVVLWQVHSSLRFTFSHLQKNTENLQKKSKINTLNILPKAQAQYVSHDIIML